MLTGSVVVDIFVLWFKEEKCDEVLREGKESANHKNNICQVT
jgi:hypothetical protein